MTVRFIYPLELIYRDGARARPLRLIARTLQSPRAPVSAGCPTAARSSTWPTTINSSPGETYEEGQTQCRANPRHRTGRSPPRWRSPREGTSRRRSSRGVTAIFPKTPASYGFSIVAKNIPGREEKFYEHARTIEKTIAEQPDALAVLKLHYLRWLLFPIKGETYFMYQGIFDTDFDKYTEDAVTLFSATGITTVFENRRIPEGLEDPSGVL